MFCRNCYFIVKILLLSPTVGRKAYLLFCEISNMTYIFIRKLKVETKHLNIKICLENAHTASYKCYDYYFRNIFHSDCDKNILESIILVSSTKNKLFNKGTFRNAGSVAILFLLVAKLL